MKSCTVSRTKTGKYFVSILCEWEHEQPDTLPDAIGIDLGITHFAILSDSRKIDNPRHLKRSERRLKIRQRRLSRKKRGGSNRNKARQRHALTHEKVANQRRDFHHQTSRELVDQYGYIALESLNVSGMLKNHKLAKAISDVGWSQFVSFLKYKQEWNNGHVDQIDPWFPSSKTCSACGAINRSLKLSDREWCCDNCGATHDRDTNAGINILNHALDNNTAGAAEIYAREIRPVVRQSAREAQLL
jgi:putative transposase